ncbi:probable calcium-binding protein CML31 [Aegilops tauschii subsp. strangulata]|uniref:EF-hand domain-containing protein n=1 Tax=Aegilops tauschii subsp. strangulata TaxID=200361 RepID=A0A453GPT2_AEGTS|nr:probable calcium-binding protein CML31 [Aegilops tauschii subsp. strangulata]
MVATKSGELRALFASLDQNGDGRVSAAELRGCMRATLGEDVPAEEAEALVASADADGDGLLCEAEFLELAQQAAWAGAEDEDNEQRTRALREAFRMYEMEGQGCITPASLGRMLGRLGTERGAGECHAMICRFDLDGNGVLSFDEFKIMMS